MVVEAAHRLAYIRVSGHATSSSTLKAEVERLTTSLLFGRRPRHDELSLTLLISFSFFIISTFLRK